MNEIIIDGGDPILDSPTSYDISDFLLESDQFRTL